MFSRLSISNISQKVIIQFFWIKFRKIDNKGTRFIIKLTTLNGTNFWNILIKYHNLLKNMILVKLTDIWRKIRKLCELVCRIECLCKKYICTKWLNISNPLLVSQNDLGFDTNNLFSDIVLILEIFRAEFCAFFFFFFFFKFSMLFYSFSRFSMFSCSVSKFSMFFVLLFKILFIFSYFVTLIERFSLNRSLILNCFLVCMYYLFAWDIFIRCRLSCVIFHIFLFIHSR